MSEEVINQEVTEEVSSEAPQYTPEEQAAIDRYKESIGEKEAPSVVDTEYNEDGTPKEELIAGKFKSQEDLVKAYEELQKKMGQQSTESEPVAEDAPTETTEETEEAPEALNPTTAKYEQEFVENGELSDASYDELAKMGFSKAQVDQYIQGQQYFAESVRSQIYETVGGEESYAELMEWVSGNMDQAVIEAYNNAVDSLDREGILRNLDYMKLKHGQSQPTQTRRLDGDSPAAGVQPYQNKNEWQRDMTSRLYGKDMKFTNMVDQRYLAARKKGLL